MLTSIGCHCQNLQLPIYGKPLNPVARSPSRMENQRVDGQGIL